MDKLSLPFSIKHVLAGFARVYGVLKLEENTILLEFQTVDNIVKVLKSDVKNYSIPIADVEEIDFKKSIWGNKLTLRASKLNDIKDVPNQESGEIKLSIEGKYTEQALNLVKQINPKKKEEVK
jgi:hypothetical protein